MRIAAIALNTFREAVRNRVLGVLVLFGVGLMTFSLVLGQLSLHEEERIIKDLGLAGTSACSIVVALFLGVNLLSKELDKKTVYAVIPKPLHRWEFVVGKYAGLSVTLGSLVVLMSMVLAVLLVSQDAHHGAVMIRAEALILMEVLLLVAVALVFASFSSPYLSAMFTASIWIIGRNSAELRMFRDQKLDGSLAGSVVDGVLVVIPDFRMFFISGSNMASDVVSIHGGFVDWGYVATAGTYCVGYSAVCLLVAVSLFARRDFT
jgi:ABC-type transport system involved in multi-copper enzyme maturation permease subunit